MKNKQHNFQPSEDNKQILHKVEWKRTPYGGQSGKQKKFDEGDLLRPAMLDEIIPERENYFMRPNGKGNLYYLIPGGFSKKVHYDDIKDLIKSRLVFVYKDYKNGK